MSPSHPHAPSTLFDPLRIGALQLPHRILMAPLTRNRAPQATPTALMAEYYAQRAEPSSGAALIFSEATQISPQGMGYQDTPGIHSAEQVAAWRQVTDAVHARGGLIACQLWHVGRISHTALQPGGAQPVSSVDVTAKGRTLVGSEFVPCSPPRALRDEEIMGIVADYAQATRCALDAGFDAVEVHAANGYLIEQFLRDSINTRPAPWGGSLDARTQLLVEVMQAVVAQAGAGRTGLRLSPVTPSNDAALDSDPQGLHAHILHRLAALKPAFVHVVEGSTGGPRDFAPFDYAALQAQVQSWGGAWVVNNGYTAELAHSAVAAGRADAVAFGRPFIANPDLSARIRHARPWAEPQRKTFYGGGAEGYTDYPAWAGNA